MAGSGGFEPHIKGVRVLYSTVELQAYKNGGRSGTCILLLCATDICITVYTNRPMKIGTPKENRTPLFSVTGKYNELLYYGGIKTW